MLDVYNLSLFRTEGSRSGKELYLSAPRWVPNPRQSDPIVSLREVLRVNGLTANSD